MNGVDSLELGQLVSIERVALLKGDLNRQVLLYVKSIEKMIATLSILYYKVALSS